MKLNGGRVEAFLKSPGAVRAVLVYGADTGLVRERVERLMRLAVEDLRDPFRVAELSPAHLKDDPARLADEAAALALTGGKRVVVVRDGGDSITGVVGAFLGHPVGDALVVVEASELGPRSSLRKLFETADNAAALACYADEGASLAQVIAEELKAAGLTIESDALAFLTAHLGADRRLTRAELTKLALYMGEPGRVTLADAVASVGDASALSLDDLCFGCADGDVGTALSTFERLLGEGTQPISVLRTVGRHFQRLHLAAGWVEKGRSPEDAIGQLKPPVIFKSVERFRRQLGRWPADRLGRALQILLEAESDCKTTGMPAAEITGRALIALARAAGRR